MKHHGGIGKLRGQRPRLSGEIAVGMKADLCVVGLGSFHLAPAIDIPNLIVNSMGAEDVEMTMVDGKVAYERGSANCGFPSWPSAAAAREELLAAVRRLGLLK